MFFHAGEELLQAQNLNLENEKEIALTNSQSNVILEKVISEHGALAGNIKDNALPNNAKSIMAQLTANPNLYYAAPGHTRVAVKNVDVSQLHYDLHGRWETKDGKPADLDDYTTWHVYDIPHPAKDETVPISGADLKRLFPQCVGGAKITDDATFNLPVTSLISLATSERVQNRELRTAEINQNRGALNTPGRIIADQLAGLRAQLASLPKTVDDGGNDKVPNPEAVEIRKQISALNDQLAQLMSGVNPAFKHPDSTHPAVRAHLDARKRIEKMPATSWRRGGWRWWGCRGIRRTSLATCTANYDGAGTTWCR